MDKVLSSARNIQQQHTTRISSALHASMVPDKRGELALAERLQRSKYNETTIHLMFYCPKVPPPFHPHHTIDLYCFYYFTPNGVRKYVLAYASNE